MPHMADDTHGPTDDLETPDGFKVSLCFEHEFCHISLLERPLLAFEWSQADWRMAVFMLMDLSYKMLMNVIPVEAGGTKCHAGVCFKACALIVEHYNLKPLTDPVVFNRN
jgi:hypothetical protein